MYNSGQHDAQPQARWYPTISVRPDPIYSRARVELYREFGHGSSTIW